MKARALPVRVKYYDTDKGEAAIEGVDVGNGVVIPPQIFKLMNRTPRYKRIKTEEEKEHDRKTRDYSESH